MTTAPSTTPRRTSPCGVCADHGCAECTPDAVANAPGTLPLGRCFRCGNPATVDAITAICPGCLPAVHRFYAADRKLDRHPEGPGWLVADDGDGAYIARDDSRGMFADDEAAADFVSNRMPKPRRRASLLDRATVVKT